MVRLAAHEQIAVAVIRLVHVYVMDNFSTLERPTQSALCHVTVLQFSDSIWEGEYDISIGLKIAPTLPLNIRSSRSLPVVRQAPTLNGAILP